MYNKILAALDIERESDLPIISANRLACEQHAELRAVTVVRPSLLSGKGFFTADVVDRDSLILEAKQALRSRIQATCGGGIDMDVAVGKPSEIIAQVAEHRGSELIVLGARRREGSERILGTTATDILREAEGADIYACHRSDPEAPTERVIVAIDGSKLSRHVLAVAHQYVSACPAEHGCSVHVVCVVPENPRDAEAMAESAQRYLNETQWPELLICVETDGVVAGFEQIIREYDADLLIIGSGNNVGPGWSIGSTTNSLLHDVSCDVLVTRP